MRHDNGWFRSQRLFQAEQHLSQGGCVREALQHRVHEAGVTQILQPRALRGMKGSGDARFVKECWLGMASAQQVQRAGECSVVFTRQFFRMSRRPPPPRGTNTGAAGVDGVSRPHCADISTNDGLVPAGAGPEV